MNRFLMSLVAASLPLSATAFSSAVRSDCTGTNCNARVQTAGQRDRPAADHIKVAQQDGAQQTADSERQEAYKALNFFGDVFEKARSRYVDKPNDWKLIEGAVRGMLESLDPDSTYYDPKKLQSFSANNSGKFGGLGIEITMDNGLVKVISPIDDSPAADAGLLANDLITRIDSQDVLGLSLEQAVEKMRGPINTPVILTVVREGQDKPFDVRLVRAIVQPKVVKSHAENDVAYIRMSAFNDKTDGDLVTAIQSLKVAIGPHLKGYVIDVRNNPGGVLDAAISTSDEFLQAGVIMSSKGRTKGDAQRFLAKPGDITEGKRIAVLINGGTAGSSEIFAGALQDNKRATIIGTRSFGRGTLQTIIPLGNHGAIRLTTERHFTPSDRPIAGAGIKPDMVVEQKLPVDAEAQDNGAMSGEAKRAKVSAYVPKDSAEDKQLQAALAFVRKSAASAGIGTPKPSANRPPQRAEAPTREASSPVSEVELELWQSVKDSNDPAELEAYLSAFPAGTFVPLARIRLKNARREQPPKNARGGPPREAPKLAELPPHTYPEPEPAPPLAAPPPSDTPKKAVRRKASFKYLNQRYGPLSREGKHWYIRKGMAAIDGGYKQIGGASDGHRGTTLQQCKRACLADQPRCRAFNWGGGYNILAVCLLYEYVEFDAIATSVGVVGFKR